jgi:hypothetical protein
MDGDFIVSSHQVDIGVDGTIEKLMGVVMDMTEGEELGDGPGFQRSVVAAGTPTVVLHGHDV